MSGCGLLNIRVVCTNQLWAPPPHLLPHELPPSHQVLLLSSKSGLAAAAKMCCWCQVRRRTRPAAFYSVDLCRGCVFHVSSVHAACRRKVVSRKARGLDAIFGVCVSQTAEA